MRNDNPINKQQLKLRTIFKESDGGVRLSKEIKDRYDIDNRLNLDIKDTLELTSAQLEKLQIDLSNALESLESLSADCNRVTKVLNLPEKNKTFEVAEENLALIVKIKNWADQIINKSPPSITINPLELEVEKMIEDGLNRNSEKIRLGDNYIEPSRISGYKRYKRGKWTGEKNDINRDSWENPLEYLETVYGKYLSRYNKTKINFLFQYQLEKIDPRFKRTLTNYIQRNKDTKIWTHGELKDHVPAKKSEFKSEIEEIIASGKSKKIIQKLNYKIHKS